MASMDADGTELGARLKKSKRLAAKTAGKSTKTPPPPASCIESLLELERAKNDNLKMELEITKAQLEFAKMKSVSAEPQTPSLGIVFKSLYSGERFRMAAFSVIVCRVVVWTITVSGAKQLRFRLRWLTTVFPRLK